MLLEKNQHDCIFLPYIEKNLRAVLDILKNDSQYRDKSERLRAKIRNEDEFFDILPEIEWVEYLNEKKFVIIIEPLFPNRGPDLELIRNRLNVYCEIKSVRLSQEDEFWSHFAHEIKLRIEKIKSNFHVSIEFMPIFKSDDIFSMINLIKKEIKKYQNQRIESPITSYYFGNSRIIEVRNHDGINDDEILEDIKRSECKIIYYPTETNENHTSVSFIFPVIIEDNIDNIIDDITKKLDQLPKEIPAIVTIDASQTLPLLKKLEWALFGRPQVTIYRNKETGEYIGSRPSRERRGVFYSVTRISAIIYYRRVVAEDGIYFERKVYRNPNAQYPFTDQEARLFGELMN